MVIIAKKESKRTVGWDGRGVIIQVKIANDLIHTHIKWQNTFSHPFNFACRQGQHVSYEQLWISSWALAKNWWGPQSPIL